MISRNIYIYIYWWCLLKWWQKYTGLFAGWRDWKQTVSCKGAMNDRLLVSALSVPKFLRLQYEQNAYDSRPQCVYSCPDSYISICTILQDHVDSICHEIKAKTWKNFKQFRLNVNTSAFSSIRLDMHEKWPSSQRNDAIQLAQSKGEICIIYLFLPIFFPIFLPFHPFHTIATPLVFGPSKRFVEFPGSSCRLAWARQRRNWKNFSPESCPTLNLVGGFKHFYIFSPIFFKWGGSTANQSICSSRFCFFWLYRDCKKGMDSKSLDFGLFFRWFFSDWDPMGFITIFQPTCWDIYFFFWTFFQASKNQI